MTNFSILLAKTISNPTTKHTPHIENVHFTIWIPTTNLSIMRMDFINTELDPCGASSTQIDKRSSYPIVTLDFRLDLYTQLCLYSYTTPLVHLHVICSKLYRQPFKQDPTSPVPTHPSTYFQTILAFFISRLETHLL